MGRIAVVLRFIFILFLLNPYVLISCKNYTSISLDNGYNLFILENGEGHFSLEYPLRYHVGVVEIYNEPEYTFTHVTFSWYPPKEREKDLAGTFIIIDIIPAYKDAKANLQFSLSMTQKARDDYQLLEEFELEIAGSHGYGAVFSYTEIPDLQDSPTDALPKPRIVRELTFKHNDLIFDIYMTYDASNAEIDKPYFGHIIETFKFLN
ncbi:MAG: hypothetical protein JXA17_07020 [Dehalococcoidales bacterium]|nr:hypothetical protein [Dehalococcoidales bacterium]